MSALTGEPARRTININAAGALLGPSFGKASDLIAISNAASRGEWTEADTHRVRKLVPLQNIFYLRWLFDQAEAGINSAFGVRKRRR